jgi:hypothetical protein
MVKSKKDWMAENSKGFYNVTTFSIDMFKGPVLNGMQTICGYRLNPYISIGGGVGLERYVGMNMYDTLTANLSLLPFLLKSVTRSWIKKFLPFLLCRVGTNFY